MNVRAAEPDRRDGEAPKSGARDSSSIGFGLTLIVLIVSGLLGYLNLARLDDNRRWVEHTHEVVGRLSKLTSTIQDAETGQRGYLLAEDAQYLAPYDDALTKVRAELDQLARLTADNADQQVRLATLEKHIDARLAELHQTVSSMKQGQRAEALRLVKSDAGKALMDEVRARISEMQKAEADLLVLREVKVADSYRIAVVSLAFCTLVGIGLVVVVFLSARRNAGQRRRAAMVLAEQKERLRTTLASIGDGVISTDARGDVTYLNAVAESLTGWTNDAAAGVPLTQVFHIVNETTRQPVANPALRALEEGVIVGLANHTILIAKDGVERPIDDSAAPIRCAEGELVGSVLVFREISERKRDEAAREERSRLVALRADVSTALASSADLPSALRHVCEALARQPDVALARIWLLDVESRVLDLAASAGPHTPSDELHGRIPADESAIGRIAVDRRPRVTSSLADDPEFRDGGWSAKQGLVAFAGFPLTVEDRVVGVVGIFARRPLTAPALAELAQLTEVIAQFIERRGAEAERRQSEAFSRGIFESIPDCVKVLDAEGRVVRMNANGLLLMEIEDFGPLAGRAWCDLWPEEGRAEVLAALAEARQSGHARFQGARPTVKGNFKWWDVQVARVRDDSDTVVHFITVSRDITHQRLIEEQLRVVASELSDADRRKDEFLATLAHELRNPLAPLNNGLQILRHARDDGASIERVRGMMERQLSQMVHLVDDLLDVSRISQGKLELRRQHIDLSIALTNALDTSRPVIESRGHELVVALPSVPMPVHADATRLAQVFANLLNNAAKFSEPGSRIRLAAELSGREVLVTVTDNGIGIPREMLPKVFDLFTQVDRSLERASGGLGIGLTLVKRLVEMHGGSVEARSEGPGRGSEFVVRLPLASPTADGAPAQPESRARDRAGISRKILVADDNADSAESLAAMLRILGNEVRTASNGEEAVEFAQSFLPDVILMDIGMPRLNGYEACRRIRTQRRKDKTVIIALTGWGQDEDRRRSQEAGFDGHMIKPVDLGLLETMLARFAPREG